MTTFDWRIVPITLLTASVLAPLVARAQEPQPDSEESAPREEIEPDDGTSPPPTPSTPNDPPREPATRRPVRPDDPTVVGPRAMKPPPPAPVESNVIVTAEPGKGVTLQSADNRFAMQLRGRIQVRDTLAINDEISNEIAIRTVRLFWQGHTLSPDFKYYVQLALGPHEFEPNNPSPVFDAFLEYTGVRAANLRIGQYFVPFDRARTIREFALQLVDRQQVITELTLDRDIGLMLYSTDLFGTGGHVGYHLGLFGGNGRNRFGSIDPVGFLYVGRIVLRPFGEFNDDMEGDQERRPNPRLAIGLAGAYNQNTTRQRSTTGAFYAFGDVDYLHAAADLVFKFRGFSLLAEAVVRKASVDELVGEIDGVAASEWTRSGWGYMVQAGYMLTRRFELAARWDRIYAFAGTDPAFVQLADRNGRELGAGFNIYLNGHLFKIQADYGLRYGEVGHEKHVVRAAIDVSF